MLCLFKKKKPVAIIQYNPTLVAIQQITLPQFLMGRDTKWPLTDAMKVSAPIVVTRANLLLAHFGQYRKVTSGYRPPAINNATPGAAAHSNHEVCEAVDLEDKDGQLDRFCMANQDLLASIGLWLESPTDTPRWTHVQIVPPASGHRVFIA